MCGLEFGLQPCCRGSLTVNGCNYGPCAMDVLHTWVHLQLEMWRVGRGVVFGGCG